MGNIINKKVKSKDKKYERTQLSKEEINLLLKKTHFSREQIIEWHQGFIRGLNFFDRLFID
jgi:hypothetical protein